MTTPITFRTDDLKRDRIDAIAEALGRTRNWCINEALDNYLEMHEWQTEHIRNRMAANDASQTLSTEEVKSLLAGHHERRMTGKRGGDSARHTAAALFSSTFHGTVPCLPHSIYSRE